MLSYGFACLALIAFVQSCPLTAALPFKSAKIQVLISVLARIGLLLKCEAAFVSPPLQSKVDIPFQAKDSFAPMNRRFALESSAHSQQSYNFVRTARKAVPESGDLRRFGNTN